MDFKGLYILMLLVVGFIFHGHAQGIQISGKVTIKNRNTVEGTIVGLQKTIYTTTTDANGNYILKNIPPGKYQLVVVSINISFEPRTIHVSNEDINLDLTVDSELQTLEEVEIQGQRKQTFGVGRLGAIEGTAIYEAKKNEVIILKDLNANLAANTARQVFSKVPGLNVWESDGGGIQLGIAARGLNPSRTADFNMRQNGYDISADALGYPEAYYTPPMEALERIEVVRGAASLQYGTQFGGLVNFVLKKPVADKKIQLITRQTGGSFGFFNSFNILNGTVGKWSYLTYYQYKRGDGWRPNGEYVVQNLHAHVGYQATPRFKVAMEYTLMNYLAHQSGGLTDAMFKENPRTSMRARNWFGVDWNLFALTADYKLGDHTHLNIRNFALISSRKSLGNLNYINRVDNLALDRDLLYDNYKNFGNETRLIHSYNLINSQKSTLLIGFKLYKGLTHRRQGRSDNGMGANFVFNQPNNLEYSDHQFPNYNYSFFAEHIFKISSKFSITPGMRIEYIKTITDGYYRTKIPYFPDSITSKQFDDNQSTRSFPFFGIGVSYKAHPLLEIYANGSQNYKAINFNDLRLNNPNLVVDPNLKDERGYNLDLGIRGNKNRVFNYDVSLFCLVYNSRISSVLKVAPDSISTYRFRTNVANSTCYGIESFGEIDFLKLFNDSSRYKLSLFVNLALLNARYHSDRKELDGKYVELAPPIMARSGLTFGVKNFSMTTLFSYVAQQYSDASNVNTITNTAIVGIIPAYYVCDLNASYSYRNYGLQMGINNVLNNIYFTRRAESYPGPGIIPSDARNFYVTVTGKF